MKFVLVVLTILLALGHRASADDVNRPYLDLFACVYVASAVEVFDRGSSVDSAINSAFENCSSELKVFVAHQNAEGFRTGKNFEQRRLKKIIKAIFSGFFQGHGQS